MDYVLAFVLGLTLSACLTYTPIEKFEPDQLPKFVGAVRVEFEDDYTWITNTGNAVEFNREYDPIQYDPQFFTCNNAVWFLLDSLIDKVVVEHEYSFFTKTDFVKMCFHARGDHPVFKKINDDRIVCCEVLNKETAVLEKLRAAGIEVWALDEKTKARHPTYAWTGLWSDLKKDQ